MVSWRAKKQALYGGSFLLIVFVVGIIFYAAYLYKPETCFDGKKNQNEVTVDCGGVCDAYCIAGAPVVVEWSRVLERTTGEIDVASLVQNSNLNFEIDELAYTFYLYDKDNLLITQREGTLPLSPQESALIIERNIAVGKRIPARVFIEVEHKTPWKRSEMTGHSLSVVERRLVRDDEETKGLVRLDARVVNNAFRAENDVVLTALIFDVEGTIASVATTRIDSVAADTSEAISFIFPHPIPETPGRIDVFIRTDN